MHTIENFALFADINEYYWCKPTARARAHAHVCRQATTRALALGWLGRLDTPTRRVSKRRCCVRLLTRSGRRQDCAALVLVSMVAAAAALASEAALPVHSSCTRACADNAHAHTIGLLSTCMHFNPRHSLSARMCAQFRVQPKIYVILRHRAPRWRS